MQEACAALTGLCSLCYLIRDSGRSALSALSSFIPATDNLSVTGYWFPESAASAACSFKRQNRRRRQPEFLIVRPAGSVTPEAASSSLRGPARCANFSLALPPQRANHSPILVHRHI